MYSKTLLALFGAAFLAALVNAQDTTGTQAGGGAGGQTSNILQSATDSGMIGGESASSTLAGASSSDISGSSSLASSAASSSMLTSSPASMSSTTSSQGMLSSLRSRASSLQGTSTDTGAGSSNAGASLTGDLPNSVFLQASALAALFVTSFVVLLA